MDTDHNLLFGALALQTGLIDSYQFAESCKHWGARPEKSLRDVLGERAWFSPADTRHLEELPPADAVNDFQGGVVVLRELSQILGLFRETPKTAKAGDDQLANGLMQLLIDLRTELRKAKNFALADLIRKRLGELGVTLEDRPGGTGWRVG